MNVLISSIINSTSYTALLGLDYNVRSGTASLTRVDKLYLKQQRTWIDVNKIKNSFCCSGAVAWNSFPVDLRQTTSLNAFRSGYSRFFP